MNKLITNQFVLVFWGFFSQSCSVSLDRLQAATLSYPACISYQECVWPSRWWRPAHGLQGHTGWWVYAGPCLAAEGPAWQIASLALPLGGGTRWCWRNLGMKNKTHEWLFLVACTRDFDAAILSPVLINNCNLPNCYSNFLFKITAAQP